MEVIIDKTFYIYKILLLGGEEGDLNCDSILTVRLSSIFVRERSVGPPNDCLGLWGFSNSNEEVPPEGNGTRGAPGRWFVISERSRRCKTIFEFEI